MKDLVNKKNIIVGKTNKKSVQPLTPFIAVYRLGILT